MIELTASLFNLQMLTAPEGMGETGAEVAVSGQFAQLLAANLEQAADPGAALTPPVQMVPPRPPAANGMATGKTGGKILPVMAVPAGKQPSLPGEVRSEKLVASEEAIPVEAESDASPAPPAMPILGEPTAPEVLPVALALPDQPAKAAPASFVAKAPVQGKVPVQSMAPSQIKVPVSPRQLGQTIRQALRSTAIAPVHSALPSLPARQPANSTLPGVQPVPADLPRAIAGKPADPLVERPIGLEVQGQQVVSVTRLAPLAQIAVLEPAAMRQSLADPSPPKRGIAKPQPEANPETLDPAPVPAQTVVLTVPAGIAAIIPIALHPRMASKQPVVQAVQLPQPAPATAPAATPAELPILAPIAVQAAIPDTAAQALPPPQVRQEIAAQPGKGAASTPPETNNQPPLPTEALAQPADSRIAAPLVPQQSTETASAPPSFAQPQQPDAPRDFSALIDRLVEAREAARTSLAPQAVQAAVAHADFGKVELRFEQRAGQLSVSLASTDPDFARAVQAAAPAAQQQDLPRDTGAPPQRHDTGERASAGGNLAQSQQQPGAHRSPGADPRSQERPERHEPQPRSDARGPRRNGIFA